METPPIVTPWYLDKAFWLVILTPVCAILASKLGLNINAADLVGLVLPVVAYVLGHKWKTATLQAAQMAANSAAAQVATQSQAAAALRGAPAP